MSHRSPRGFTLIELLIVVAIVGIISAIAIPNLLQAIDRGKQKRTMADLRAIGATVEAYAVDVNAYPTSANINALASVVQSVYNKNMPTKDGWGSDMIYTPSAGTGYTVGSGGRDGGGLSVVGSGGPTANFNDAIIFIGGQFVQWPEGAQQ